MCKKNSGGRAVLRPGGAARARVKRPRTPLARRRRRRRRAVPVTRCRPPRRARTLYFARAHAVGLAWSSRRRRRTRSADRRGDPRATSSVAVVVVACLVTRAAQRQRDRFTSPSSPRSSCTHAYTAEPRIAYITRRCFPPLLPVTASVPEKPAAETSRPCLVLGARTHGIYRRAEDLGSIV